MTLQRNKPRRLKKHRPPQINYWIVWQRTRTPPSGIVLQMILHIHSDASYLSVSNAHSRLGGLFFCGEKSPQQD
jgi:hypothetical protein